MDKRDTADEKNVRSGKPSLRELAAEASRHLDDILPGEGSNEGRRHVRPELKSASDKGPVDWSSGVKGGHDGGYRLSRPGAGTDKRAVSAGATSAGAATAGRTPSTARGLGRTAPSKPGAGGPAALVAHVSYGMACALANILDRMGFSTTVATRPEEIDSLLGGRNWDLLFVQGTSAPYPGKKLASVVLTRCTGERHRVVLICRRGDSLFPEAGPAGAVSVIDWPFSVAAVGKTVAEVFPALKIDGPEKA